MTDVSLTTRLTTALRLRRAWRLVWQAAPGWTLCSLLLVVFQGIIPLISLYLLKQVVDSLATAVAVGGAGAFSPVAFWVALAGLVALLNMLAAAFGSHVATVLSLSVADHVADVIHAHSIAVDLGYYENPAFHDTLHRAQMDAPFRPSAIVNGLQQSVQSFLTLVGIIGLLFAFHWLVGVALFVAAFPAALARLHAARRNFTFTQDHAAQEREAWYYHWLLTGEMHARTVRLLGVGRLFAERYRRLRDGIRDGRLALSRKQVRDDVWTQGIAMLVLFGVLAAMAYSAVSGVLTLGAIVMYYQGYQRALGALQGLLGGLARLYEDNLFLKHFYDFLDLPGKIEQTAGLNHLPLPAATGLSCRNLHFTYPSRTAPTLQGVDLDIRPGEVVALVGANGAGKTTLAKLLCRLYDPDRGMIRWGGVDLREFAAAAWRRQISVLSQDYARFELTLAENIWLGDVDQVQDPDALLAAAAQAGADDVVNQFPDGLQTRLGTQFRDGQELSVGEWQRVALARTWFRDAQLVILDEPSSALDPLAEAAMIDNFRGLIGNRSALLISHRLATVRLADRIYVLDHGRVVEQGTHVELLSLDGHYARLYRAQADHFTG